MKPLTLDCARVRQQLDEHYDGELQESERAFVERHLTDCAGCRDAYAEMKRALAALSALSPEDIERLRQPLDLSDRLDDRSLSRLLIVVSIAAVVILAVGAALSVAPFDPPVESETVAAAPSPQPLAKAIPIPSVGFEVGVEVEAEPIAVEPASLPGKAAADPIAAKPRPIPIAAPLPKPARAAPRVTPRPAVAKKKPDRVVAAVPPRPLPGATKVFLERLQVSTGLMYRDLTLFFVRDPEGRDRMSSGRAPGAVRVREASPKHPALCVARPPRGRNKSLLLLGELLDAPLGLRIVQHTRNLRSRTTLPVKAVGWDGLRRKRRDALLKAPVLLPSYARRALMDGTEPGPVALLLQSLTDPSFGEMKRLQLDLARLESEAKELVRRMLARVRGTRGLRGLALSIEGKPVQLELFGSSRRFAAAFPKLLRSALLQTRLGKPLPNDDVGADYRATRILGGIKETRKSHKKLLSLLADSGKAPLPKTKRRRSVTALFRAKDTKQGVGVVYLQGETVVHALATPY